MNQVKTQGDRGAGCLNGMVGGNPPLGRFAHGRRRAMLLGWICRMGLPLVLVFIPSGGAGIGQTAGVSTPPAARQRLMELRQAMRQVEGRLRRGELDREVVSAQVSILRQLEQLAPTVTDEPSRSEGSPGGSDGTARGTPSSLEPSALDLRSPNGAGPVLEDLPAGWSRLPQREQQEVRSSLSDQLLPGYEALIRVYFKLLSSEESVGP